MIFAQGSTLFMSSYGCNAAIQCWSFVHTCSTFYSCCITPYKLARIPNNGEGKPSSQVSTLFISPSPVDALLQKINHFGECLKGKYKFLEKFRSESSIIQWCKTQQLKMFLPHPNPLRHLIICPVICSVMPLKDNRFRVQIHCMVSLTCFIQFAQPGFQP